MIQQFSLSDRLAGGVGVCPCRKETCSLSSFPTACPLAAGEGPLSTQKPYSASPACLSQLTAGEWPAAWAAAKEQNRPYPPPPPTPGTVQEGQQCSGRLLASPARWRQCGHPAWAAQSWSKPGWPLSVPGGLALLPALCPAPRLPFHWPTCLASGAGS